MRGIGLEEGRGFRQSAKAELDRREYRRIADRLEVEGLPPPSSNRIASL